MSSAKQRPMTHLTGAQAIAVARAVAVEAMPYFQKGILQLVPREAPGLGTLAVTPQSILLVDFDAIRSWTPNQAGAVMLHEYMHIFSNHDERTRKLIAAGVLSDTPEDHKLANRMGDAEINDDLIAAGLDLPSFTDKDGKVHPPVTPEVLGYPPHKLMEEYIKLEKQKHPKGRGGGGGHGAGCGGCGSGSGGVPADGEPPADDPDGRSDVDQEVSRKEVMQDIQNRVRNRGNVPAGIRRLVEIEMEPAKIPWQQKLSQMVQSAVSVRAGNDDYTMERPSRRQGAFHGWENEPRMPGMHESVAEVAIVADTSGSMGPKEMKELLIEAQSVINTMAGNEITFVACDAKVHAVVRTRNLEEIKLNMKGGGGTNFKPAFAALEEVKPRPNVVVFATDGEGEYPEVPPKDMHVIWLIVGNGRIYVDWGEQVDVNNEDLEVDEDDPGVIDAYDEEDEDEP